MSSDSSNQSRQRLARPNAITSAARENSPNPTLPDTEAVENFTFEVSAAEAPLLKKRTQAEQATTVARLRWEQAHLPEPTEKNATAHSSTPLRVDPKSNLLSEARPPIAVPTATKPARNRTSSWMTSLVLHVLILLLLSFFTLTTFKKQDELLWNTSPAAYEKLDHFLQVELDPTKALESFDAELASELPDPKTPALGDLSAESALTTTSADSALISESLNDLGTLFDDTGNGLTDMGKGPGNAATASFFGAKVQANRIVYVVDNSGGMRDGKLETLIAELLESVDSLTPKQHFYVIFYSDALYPLFFPRAPQHFVRANQSNKQLLRHWLDSVEFCMGNVVDQAVEAALSIRPDIIFLLTDGDLDSTKDQRRMRFLLHGTGGTVPIHTFGMGTGETGKAAEKLKQVAEANRGTFRAIKVSAEAKQRAQKNARPYHNRKTGPGTTWGTSFRRQ